MSAKSGKSPPISREAKKDRKRFSIYLNRFLCEKLPSILRVREANLAIEQSSILYTVSEEYIKFLSAFDSRVAVNKSEKRPYVGIVLQINDMKYYAPLTSPKPKHAKMKNTKDFRKINGGIYGAINFNNMIPVIDHEIRLKRIEDETDVKYRELLRNQLRFIQQDEENILKTAHRLRDMCLKDANMLTEAERNMKMRCCDFRLLESHYREYLI